MMMMMRHKREISYWVRVTELIMPLFNVTVALQQCKGGLISRISIVSPIVSYGEIRLCSGKNQDASCAFTHARTQRRSALYQAPERRSRDRLAPPWTWAPCYQVRSPGRGVHAIVPPAQQDKREGEAAQHVVVVGQTNAIRTSA